MWPREAGVPGYYGRQSTQGMHPKVTAHRSRVVTQAMEAGLHPSMGDDRLVRAYSQRAMLSFKRNGISSWVVWLCASLITAPAVAKHAPDPTFKTLDGSARRLSSLRGQIVVVNFWATWCAPCQEELPRLSKLAASYADKPVRFVLVSIDEPKDRARIPAALARLHVSLDTWDDADTDTMDRFGLGAIVPGTAVLDEKGDVVARIMGEARDEDVRGAVDWLLGGKTGHAPDALTKRY